MTDGFQERLAQHLGGMLTKLIGKGWTPPFYFAALAANGAIIGGTWETTPTGLTPTFSVEHFPDARGLLVMPLTITFVTRTGESEVFRVDVNEAVGH